MRSGMGLSGKRHDEYGRGRQILIYLFTFLFSGVWGLSCANASPFPVSGSGNGIVISKLKMARDRANSSLEEARKICLDAIDLCQTTGCDTLYADALLQLGDIVSLQGNNKEALSYYKEAREVAGTMNYEKGKCNALLEEGYIYYVWGAYDKSCRFFRNAYNLSVKYNLQIQCAIALNLIGKYYHTTGQYDQSVLYYSKAELIAGKLKKYDRSYSLFLNIGKTYVSEENIYMTLSYYLKAFKNSERSGNKLHQADVYNHLGSIYLLLGQPDKSLEFHYRALKLREGLNALQAIAVSCNNLGETFLSLASYDSAAVYLDRSYALCLQTGYLKGTVKSLTNLGRVNNKTGNLKEARNFLVEALELSEHSGYNAGIVESSLTLGENFVLRKEYLKAIGYFNHSLGRMLPAKLDQFRSDAYNGLYYCYRELNDYPKALDFYEKYNAAERKALLAQSNRQLTELRVSFDLERKERDNQKLRQQNELEQMKLTKRAWVIWSIAITLLLTLILCVLLYSRYVQKRNAHHNLQKVIAELELANSEKDKMFSIIAHELRNPLYWFQNLSAALSKNFSHMPAEKLRRSLLSIDESAKNAFHLMDNLLNWSRARLNRIIPRKANFELYSLISDTLVMFENIASQKKVRFNIDVPSGIFVYADSDMFNCIVRNLISNAIKYTPDGGQIWIVASRNNAFCTITVADTGIGLSSDMVPTLFSSDRFRSGPGLMGESGSGLGLKLCKEFVLLNGGEIWVDVGKKAGAEFSFTIPAGK